MSSLSSYIHTQLDSLLRQVQQTPPKRYASLKKIKSIIEQSPLDLKEKRSISKSIRQVEDTIKTYLTPTKPTIQEKQSLNFVLKPTIMLRMQTDKKAIKELLNSKLNRKVKQSSKQEDLAQQLLRLRGQRVELESYLQYLVVKVQKLQRLKESQQKIQNSDNSRQIVDAQYKKRLLKLRKMPADSETLRSSRKKTVDYLMKRFNEQ